MDLCLCLVSIHILRIISTTAYFVLKHIKKDRRGKLDGLNGLSG